MPAKSKSVSEKRKRKRAKTGHLNATPEVEQLKKEVDEKERIEREKKARQVKRKVLADNQQSNQIQAKRTCLKRESKVKKIIPVENGDSSEDDPFAASDENDSDAACIYCNELYSKARHGELWIQCQVCNQWCHIDCAGVEKKVKMFTCELCV